MLSSFYRWKNWGSERSSDLHKSHSQEETKWGFKLRSMCFQSSSPNHMPLTTTLVSLAFNWKAQEGYWWVWPNVKAILHIKEAYTSQFYPSPVTQEWGPHIVGSSYFTREANQDFYKNLNVRSHLKTNKKDILGANKTKQTKLLA